MMMMMMTMMMIWWWYDDDDDDDMMVWLRWWWYWTIMMCRWRRWWSLTVQTNMKMLKVYALTGYSTACGPPVRVNIISCNTSQEIKNDEEEEREFLKLKGAITALIGCDFLILELSLLHQPSAVAQRRQPFRCIDICIVHVFNKNRKIKCSKVFSVWPTTSYWHGYNVINDKNTMPSLMLWEAYRREVIQSS